MSPTEGGYPIAPRTHHTARGTGNHDPETRSGNKSHKVSIGQAGDNELSSTVSDRMIWDSTPSGFDDRCLIHVTTVKEIRYVCEQSK